MRARDDAVLEGQGQQVRPWRPGPTGPARARAQDQQARIDFFVMVILLS
ncbi:MAG: hypothetical protein MZU95_13250 [Desulfomicrobium escambiense]|nr:hypothetical protein [Desulfomicrobium escambiense]